MQIVPAHSRMKLQATKMAHASFKSLGLTF